MHGQLYSLSSLAPPLAARPVAAFTCCVLIALLVMSSQHVFHVDWPFYALRAGRARWSSTFRKTAGTIFKLLLVTEPVLPLKSLSGLASQLWTAVNAKQLALDQLQAELAATRQQLAQMERACDMARGELEESSANEARLTAKLEASRAEMAEFKIALENALDNSFDLELDLDKADDHNTQLLHDLQNKDADLAVAEDDLRHLERELEELCIDHKHARQLYETHVEELNMQIAELNAQIADLHRAHREIPRERERGRDSRRKHVQRGQPRVSSRPRGGAELQVAPTDTPVSLDFPLAGITVTIHPPEEPAAEQSWLLPKQHHEDKLSVWPHYRTSASGRTLRGFTANGAQSWVMWDRGCEWRTVAEVDGRLVYQPSGQWVASS
ncbi:hypothetical protein AURDEDRAFT_115329 [Auricularia subglabra TFB-10046 SS5]|nr:hypothetical protein AURDEDRAFT_115329 [Auricularia subglabra TFB-10046 SS5]